MQQIAQVRAARKLNQTSPSVDSQPGSGPPDILSSILAGQSLLQMNSKHVIINRDGSITPKQQVNENDATGKTSDSNEREGKALCRIQYVQEKGCEDNVTAKISAVANSGVVKYNNSVKECASSYFKLKRDNHLNNLPRNRVLPNVKTLEETHYECVSAKQLVFDPNFSCVRTEVVYTMVGGVGRSDGESSDESAAATGMNKENAQNTSQEGQHYIAANVERDWERPVNTGSSSHSRSLEMDRTAVNENLFDESGFEAISDGESIDFGDADDNPTQNIEAGDSDVQELNISAQECEVEEGDNFNGDKEGNEEGLLDSAENGQDVEDKEHENADTNGEDCKSAVEEEGDDENENPDYVVDEGSINDEQAGQREDVDDEEGSEDSGRAVSEEQEDDIEEDVEGNDIRDPDETSQGQDDDESTHENEAEELEDKVEDADSSMSDGENVVENQGADEGGGVSQNEDRDVGATSQNGSAEDEQEVSSNHHDVDELEASEEPSRLGEGMEPVSDAESSDSVKPVDIEEMIEVIDVEAGVAKIEKVMLKSKHVRKRPVRRRRKKQVLVRQEESVEDGEIIAEVGGNSNKVHRPKILKTEKVDEENKQKKSNKRDSLPQKQKQDGFIRRKTDKLSDRNYRGRHRSFASDEENIEHRRERKRDRRQSKTPHEVESRQESSRKRHRYRSQSREKSKARDRGSRSRSRERRRSRSKSYNWRKRASPPRGGRKRKQSERSPSLRRSWDRGKHHSRDRSSSLSKRRSYHRSGDHSLSPSRSRERLRSHDHLKNRKVSDRSKDQSRSVSPDRFHSTTKNSAKVGKKSKSRRKEARVSCERSRSPSLHKSRETRLEGRKSLSLSPVKTKRKKRRNRSRSLSVVSRSRSRSRPRKKEKKKRRQKAHWEDEAEEKDQYKDHGREEKTKQKDPDVSRERVKEKKKKKDKNKDRFEKKDEKELYSIPARRREAQLEKILKVRAEREQLEKEQREEAEKLERIAKRAEEMYQKRQLEKERLENEKKKEAERKMKEMEEKLLEEDDEELDSRSLADRRVEELSRRLAERRREDKLEKVNRFVTADNLIDPDGMPGKDIIYAFPDAKNIRIMCEFGNGADKILPEPGDECFLDKSPVVVDDEQKEDGEVSPTDSQPTPVFDENDESVSPIPNTSKGRMNEIVDEEKIPTEKRAPSSTASSSFHESESPRQQKATKSPEYDPFQPTQSPESADLKSQGKFLLL